MASKKVAKLRRKIAKLKAKLALPAEFSQLVSPLAPKGGFPALSVISGVRYSALAAGVHYQGRNDVTLIELAADTVVSGVFTSSKTRSAAVLDCREKIGLDGSGPAAILVNSGNANAFTGSHGQKSVEAITSMVAASMGIKADRVFTSSTGVIGEPLAHDRIIAKIGDLVDRLDENSGESAARAIMTTDTFAKGANATLETTGGNINIAGFAKGSGMIAPDMATMLVYIFTDAKIARPLLQSIVAEISDRTLNCITVDSDTSTSDTLLVAATGRSGADEIVDTQTGAGAQFRAALHKVMLDLAHQVVRDGEGATKFVAVNVTGAVNDDDAKKVAVAIANSPLVKTAVAGEDPNWGRVVMAVGKAGAEVDRDKLTIHFGDVLVAENGWVAPSYSEDAGAAYMKRSDLVIRVDLGMGSHEATVWTCDLTKRYIEINADYRS
jgi:glutamate N-acetyltransferase/amino-acid N-acetyltransferase